uniref:F-BAR domain-containing protein n=1 Tax=Setaria digitata TaxID=48799 RepID=A0A915PZ62_9BILA
MSSIPLMRRSQRLSSSFVCRHSCSALPPMNNNTIIPGSSNTNSSKDSGDKTERSFRRRRTTSFSKLSQFLQTGSVLGGSGSIQSALLDLSATGKLMTKIAESQRRGIESLAIWAHNAGNTAIDDVMQQTRQLYEIFIEKELQFARQYEHYVQQLQKIADAERAMKDEEEKVMYLEEKERKLEREVEKGVSFFKQRRGGDIYLLRQKLEQTKASREHAQRNLSDHRAEMEVVKMFRFRNGMQGIADSYQDFARSCAAIFNCQREIIEMVPAVSDQDVRHMVYCGTPLTKNRVDDLRRSLQRTMLANDSSPNSTTLVSRQCSELKQHVSRSERNSPPPPYTFPLFRNEVSAENEVGARYQVNYEGCQTCSHCGQSVQQSADYQLKRPALAGGDT